MREVWQIKMVSLRKETEQQNSQIIYQPIASVDADILSIIYYYYHYYYYIII